MQLKEVLAKIEKGETVDLEWVSCWMQKKKGGKIMRELGLRLLIEHSDRVSPNDHLRKRVTYTYEHSCQYMNIFQESTGRFYCIYKRLIIKCNNEEVTY